MELTESPPTRLLRQEDPFHVISPEDFGLLGIDPLDIPLGTFPALKHPSQIPSRFGGNAYGFGLFETHDRLAPNDISLLQSIAFDNAAEIAKHYKEINQIYKKLGLLTRFTRKGKPYYLIPAHLVSDARSQTKARLEEIAKVINYHRKKFLKEHHRIGVLTHGDDLILHELSFQFKEHQIVVLDSLEKIRGFRQTLDMVIITRDLYEILLMEKFSPLSAETLSRKRLDQYALYILWKLYNLVKTDGEIFIIANHRVPKTNRTAQVRFKSLEEEKNFTLFSHIFRTRRKYRIKDHKLEVNVFDFHRYLSGAYVEYDVVNRLLEGRRIDQMSLSEIDALPYLNFPLSDFPLPVKQDKAWSDLLSVYCDTIFLRPATPESVKQDLKKRFALTGYDIDFFMVYMGQTKPQKIVIPEVIREVAESKLIGCPLELSAEYRDTFEYVIRTLRVVEKLKKRSYEGLPPIYMDRLTQPLENKNRRFKALNDVLRLIEKIGRLERVRRFLNPDNIEGSKTKVMANLDAVALSGFSRDEIKEILYIVLGHTPLGRIISGKINEKSLRPVCELARTYSPREALNLLRFCRLMTMAETEASRQAPFTVEQLAELFDLYESEVRIVTRRDLDWDVLLDEKITAMGGIQSKVVRKLLKMTNHFEFLESWNELSRKGPMEKEVLAEYDEEKFMRIENVIKLVNTVEQFEKLYLKSAPLQITAFYRKVLEMEFHGTGHLFERLDGQHVFVLVWIMVNLARGEIINFNPVLADLEPPEVDERIKGVEEEAEAISIHHLDFAILKDFGDQLHQSGTAFIAGTGFQVKVNPAAQALEIAYLDMDRDIAQLRDLSEKLAGVAIHDMSAQDLTQLETLFSDLESFVQSHLRLLQRKDSAPKLPARQRRWFRSARELRETLRTNLIHVLFQPETLYTDLMLLHQNAPKLLNFLLPEFTALEGVDLSGHTYLKSSIVDYILATAKKLQALVGHDRERFQDFQLLHRLAGREFGPMATGTVGLSDAQLSQLESIVDRLRSKPSLFGALVSSFVFQDLGRVPYLQARYREHVTPGDPAHASALFLQREGIIDRYSLAEGSEEALLYLVRHHSLFHHIIRGEAGLSALNDILVPKDKDLCDALVVFSLVMISAMREDLTLEDLARRLFDLRQICLRVINGESTLEEELETVASELGQLFFGLQTFERCGLPENTSPAEYLDSRLWKTPGRPRVLKAGKRVLAMERLFRLRGLKHVRFMDLVHLLVKVPLKFIYQRRRFSSIGYASFEKEVYEALRMYNMLQNLNESLRHFILEQLDDDRVRIFGYEKISGYLTYENQFKLLLIGLKAGGALHHPEGPVLVDYLAVGRKIEKRYEAVNHFLSDLSLDKLWKSRHQIRGLFRAGTGIVLRKEGRPGAVSVDFRDHRVDISQKIATMDEINNVDQLKNYFHHSLRSLRKRPFYTDDYELQLEKAFEERLRQITETILAQTEQRMESITDFGELHTVASDLLKRSWDIGFSVDQKHRLTDLYELRKDQLKREHLSNIEQQLGAIGNSKELTEYWDTVKSFLQTNRHHLGKEFERLVAGEFDRTRALMNTSGS